MPLYLQMYILLRMTTTGSKRFKKLSRDELEARLAIAEDLAALYAWSPARHETENEKAAYQMCAQLDELVGGFRPVAFPHLTREVIADLAAQTDEGHRRTLERMQVHPRSVRISNDLWGAAQRRASERGESVTDAIRRGLEDYVGTSARV